MADTKNTGLAELAAVPADDDLLYLVDISDTSMAGTGTSKKNKAKYYLRTNGTANTLGANIAANNYNFTGAGTVGAGAILAANYYGGTASGGSVVIDSTAHATKGKIVIQPSGGSVAIGHANPDYNLDVAGGFQCTTAGAAWTNVTFNTGWGNTGGGNQTCQYKKFGDIVFIRGLASRSSGAETIIFTLPSGFRPPASDRFPCLTDAGGPASVTIDTGGNVAYLVGSPTDYITLSGIWFSTV